MKETIGELKDLILISLKEKNAEDISVIELGDQTPLAKYMIFASGKSLRNVRAIAEYVVLELKHKLKWPANLEGLESSDWVLIDAGDIIVHVFHPEAREKFKLEELWQEKK